MFFNEVDLFFRLHRTFMFFVNQRLQVLPLRLKTPEEFARMLPEVRLRVRTAWLEQPTLLDEFVAENPARLAADELALVRSWRHYVTGKFILLRELKHYSIFLTTTDPAIAYGVHALSEPFSDMLGPYFPMLVETVLLPFRDMIVYDGLLNCFNISFGPGYRRSLNESYREAKARQGIITALPMSDQSGAKAVAAPKGKARPKPPPADRTADVVQVIAEMVDQFCREHLNEEYAELCRRLTEKLARKRPSPLLKGKPNTWACGIIRTIGWVNFLDDRTQKPHMKLPAIDKAFGVAESTGQGKSMLIRKMFKIRNMDPAWTLPSRIDQNPMAWMIEVNGFPLDARYVQREIQEEAFRKGLIPYLPSPPRPEAEE